LVFYDLFLSGHGAKICREHGQSTLEHAHIYVLNYGPTRSKVLKNLVLGVISSFTVDNVSKVCASNLGNNYFNMMLFLLYVSSFA
jgi:molybdopterin/thiamine biosynthesis adenylyltransferase